MYRDRFGRCLTLSQSIVTVMHHDYNCTTAHCEETKSTMGSVERTRELRRRRSRKEKLKKLRGRFAKAANETERAAILAQARRVSPLVSFDEK
jgi:hypothetical protein